MSVRKLNLVVMDGKRIVETAVLSSVEACWRAIIPKRAPTQARGKEAAWIIAPDKRRPLGKHVVNTLEKINRENKEDYNLEELCGFFALVGIGTRWADNLGVRWCLYLGERELKPGMNL